VAARWKLDETKGGAVARIEPFRRLTGTEHSEVSEEADRLLEFLAPEADPREARFAPPTATPPNRRPGHQPARR
jgi:hypothetical protein